jgi:two-component system alkaline phosphatase synthesis response regulator PhoP
MAKLLIVEDDEMLNQAYKLILEKEGHDVKIAFNGKEGLAIAKEFKPELILLDIMMPVMNGIEFLKAYDAPAHPETIIIVLSNLNEDSEVQEALKLGAQRYILKAGTSAAKLAMRVNHIVSKRDKL